MRLVMAVSKDGWLARCHDDNMTWLGADDKAAFRLLTSTNGGHVGVGSKTAECMPPVLPGRSLLVLSTRSCARRWGSLDDFHRCYPGGSLIGGPTVALEALRKSYITEVHLCRSTRNAFPEHGNGAIPDRLTIELAALNWQIAMKTRFGDTVVECWRK